MRAAFLLLLTAVLALAQQAGRIEGRVVSTTGEPISKATVRITGAASLAGQPATSYLEVTSSDGRFTAENIAPGKYTTSAQRPGYTPTRNTTGGVPITNFDLAAGETKSGIEIRLTPLAVVSGRVTDADGEPVPSAQVRMVRYTFTQGRLVTNANGPSVNTDDRGMFRLLNVQPGRYYLLASGGPILPIRPNEIRGRSALEVNLPTYYPGSQDVRGAVAITATETEIGNVNIRLRRGGTYWVTGTFVDPAGTPIAGQITVFEKGSDMPAQGVSTQVRAPGMFQVSGLQPGEYTIVVRANPIRPAVPAPPAGAQGVATTRLPAQSAISLSGRLDFSIGSANLDDVTIRLTEGAEITGRVTIEGGMDLQTFMGTAPLIGARPVAVNGGRPVAVNRAAVATGDAPAAPQLRMPGVALLAHEGPAAQLAATVGPDGTYRIGNIPPLKRILQITPLPANAYVKSVRFGGQDVTLAPIDLSTGTGGILDIVISTKGAEITATPRTEKGETPIGGAPVTIWPRTPNPGSPTGDVRLAAPTTAFRAQGLAPGEYYVAAWEVANTDFLRAPEFLARFAAMATKVTVAEGEIAAVDAKVISREAMEKEMAQFP